MTMRYLLQDDFAASAATHPDKIAVRDHDRQISYAELDQRSDRLASVLASEGVRPGDRVGLYFPKSLESIITVLGVLKAGGVYVPIDPKAPAPRAAFILRDCQVAAVVTDRSLIEPLARELGEPDWPLRLVLLTDEMPDQEQQSSLRAFGGVSLRSFDELDGEAGGEAVADRDGRVDTDLAYILYTSGSTGEPKGVMLSHRHAKLFVDWAATTFEVDSNDRFSSHAPLHFDLSIFDIFVCFRAGGTLILVPGELAPYPTRLAEFIEQERISVWYSVPSALTILTTRGGLGELDLKLQKVFFAGEVFPLKYVRKLRQALPKARLFNLYGPTETNVCTFYELPEDVDGIEGELPIGVACANMDAFAVDASGKPAGTDQEGELFVRGSCLMSGYWGRPEKTAERVRQNPLHSDFHDPVYATGDIVRLDDGGNYRFLGRRDHMVKVRGYRIELGEIESVFYRLDQVEEVAAIALPDEETGSRIVLVISLTPDSGWDEKRLLRHCAKFLPRYMLPDRIAIVAGLPKTSTGKTDRKKIEQELIAANR